MLERRWPGRFVHGAGELFSRGFRTPILSCLAGILMVLPGPGSLLQANPGEADSLRLAKGEGGDARVTRVAQQRIRSDASASRKRMLPSWTSGNTPMRGRLKQILSGRRLRPKPKSAPHLHWGRLAGVEATVLAGGVYVHRKYRRLFGDAGGSWRVANDWTGDYGLQFDEIMHFQGGYRLTQLGACMYRWAGLDESAALRASSLSVLAGMTYFEWLDGRRPVGESSYSDALANTLGVAFALLKARRLLPEAVDVRFSAADPLRLYQGMNALEFGRMTHWLVLDAGGWGVPLSVGVGYSVEQPYSPEARRRFYVGVGCSVRDVVLRLLPRRASGLQWLDFYQIGVKGRM